MWIRVKRLLLLGVLLLGVIAAGNPAQRAVDEASIVVAYLYNFGKFIDWPAEAFTAPDAPMRFCFYGEDTLGALTDTLGGKRVSGHPMEVYQIRRGGSLLDCHLLYIDTSERLYVRPLLSLTREAPILTVSEIDGFAAAGGIVGLVYSENKLKFR